MKKAFKIFVLFITLLTISSCGETWRLRHQTHDEYVMGSMYAYVYQYNARQLDSMCVADDLPRKLSDWTITTYSDYETGKKITKRMYIKEYSVKEEYIYLVSEEDDEMYRIIKRYVKAD